MFLTLLAFVISISVIVALLEVQIEGKNGWAKNLPTWRVDNRFITFILGPYHPLTGYHLFLNILVIYFFHFPFFVGLIWTAAFELKILSFYLLFWVIEDFLWFVLNPNFGVKKFKKGEIPWHTRWFLGIPYTYYRFLILCILLYLLSLYV